jgi:NADH-quinone oxidoreductase subunit J
MIAPILFAAFALLLLVSGLMVVLHKSPVASAMFLVVALCSLSGIYILMRAEFIGMVQVIVYAGAIMVLFLFVIMYLNLGHDAEGGATILLRRLIGWIVGAFVVSTAALLFAGRWAIGPVSQAAPPEGGNTQALGQLLYTRYLYPFEITSLVLLVAMVGAIVITKGRGTRTPDPKGHDRPAIADVLRPGDTLTPPPPPGGGPA